MKIFIIIFESINLLEKRFFNLKNTANQLSNSKFPISLIKPFLLIMNTRLHKEWCLSIKDIGLIKGLKLPMSINQPTNLRRSKITLKLSTIAKLNKRSANISTNGWIQSNISKWNKLTPYFILWTLKKKWWYCRRMTYLLEIDRNTTNITLEGLTKDWVKWFL